MLSRVRFRSPRSTCPMYVQCRSQASPIFSCDQSRAARKSRTRLPNARLMSFGTQGVSSDNTYISRDDKYYFLLSSDGMKSEIYNALAALNRAFDGALESLTILEQ